MESSAYNFTLNRFRIKQVNLNEPNKEAIAVVLGEALRQKYMESSVNWVTSHPNLSQPPFNLAAEGICGNTALLDFGDMSYTKLPLDRRNIYNFKQFLTDIGRDSSKSFIFGHGIYPFEGNLKEFVLNTSFLQRLSTSNEVPVHKNESRLTYINSSLKKCSVTLNLYNLICTVQGTYFLCHGSTTDVSVLKVHAKGLRSRNAPFTEGKRFINSMQEALQRRFGSEQFVALGGVYTVNNADWDHRVVPNEWEQSSIKCLTNRYCQVDTPETMITIFNSSTEVHSINGPPIKLHSSQSIHSLSHHSSSVTASCVSAHSDVEYLGYFCPATRVYRIDYPI